MFSPIHNCSIMSGQLLVLIQKDITDLLTADTNLFTADNNSITTDAVKEN